MWKTTVPVTLGVYEVCGLGLVVSLMGSSKIGKGWSFSRFRNQIPTSVSDALILLATSQAGPAVTSILYVRSTFWKWQGKNQYTGKYPV